MSRGAFTAPCGCAWHDDRLEVPCPVWRELIAERDRLRRDWNAEYGQLREVEERMGEHLPPWLVNDE